MSHPNSQSLLFAECYGTQQGCVFVGYQTTDWSGEAPGSGNIIPSLLSMKHCCASDVGVSTILVCLREGKIRFQLPKNTNGNHKLRSGPRAGPSRSKACSVCRSFKLKSAHLLLSRA